jgi:sulfur-oxidizing protein SoxA
MKPHYIRALGTAMLALFGSVSMQQTFAADAVKHDYWPGREKAVPHVSGDEKFSNTYRYWKDEEALKRAKSAGLMSHEMNFKDFRWLEKSFDAEPILDEGLDWFQKKNAAGKSCASCHGEKGEKLKGIHARSPSYSKRSGRVTVVETEIAKCAEDNLGIKDWKEDTRPNTLISFYLGKLSDGETIKIDVSSGPMKESYERGRDLYFKRTGHFHFACASCHTPPTAGNYLRGQRPTTFFGDASQYPIYHFPYKLEGDDLAYIFTMQHQIRSCQMLSRMYQGKEGSPSMTDMEVFLKASSNGYKMSIPVSEYNMDTNYLQPQQR